VGERAGHEPERGDERRTERDIGEGGQHDQVRGQGDEGDALEVEGDQRKGCDRGSDGDDACFVEAAGYAASRGRRQPVDALGCFFYAPLYQRREDDKAGGRGKAELKRDIADDGGLEAGHQRGGEEKGDEATIGSPQECRGEVECAHDRGADEARKRR
jgi:hypothetical protein